MQGKTIADRAGATLWGGWVVWWTGQAPSVIRAALRKRAAPELAQTSEPYVRGDLTIDYARRRVTVGGNPVELTDIEYRLLVELSANAGRALTHERLLQRVWGPDKGEDSGR